MTILKRLVCWWRGHSGEYRLTTEYSSEGEIRRFCCKECDKEIRTHITKYLEDSYKIMADRLVNHFLKLVEKEKELG